MKKLFLILLFTLLPFTIFAGPFGLKMGMTLEEVTEVCDKKPQLYREDIYYITPIKKHPLFEKYVIFVDKEKGLYSIIALSEEDYSRTVIDNTYTEIRVSISKTYGSSEKVDVGISLKDKKYSSIGTYYYCEKWEKELKDDLSCILLYETRYSYSYYDAYGLVLQYDFINKSAVEDAQDEVF